MRFLTVLSLLTLALAQSRQIFEIIATKFGDGRCEVRTLLPTQLHKDVVNSDSAHLERQILSIDAEDDEAVLLKVYGYETLAMLRLLEDECPHGITATPVMSGSVPQFRMKNSMEHMKPLPPAPPLKITPLHSSGPSSNRVDLVFFSDGYTVEEESKFLADAQRLASDISANQTFATVKPLLNIWAAFTPSNDSGIGTKEEPKDTAFGLYRVGTELRAIYCGKKPVARAACAALGTGCDYPILLANSPYYGGLGGEFSITTASALNGALVLRHELGHSIIKVGEEYDGGYAYYGPNSAPSPPSPKIKWNQWLSNPLKGSNTTIIPERAVSPVQAYPWTLLNRTHPYTSLFNSSGAYHSHMIRFSLSGLPWTSDITVLLDGADIRWQPRPGVGTDRWHYDILRDERLSMGTHNLTFSLGESAIEGLAQLCSFEVIEYGNSTEFNTNAGNVAAYPTFSMWNGTTYRPTNEGCLMRQVVLPQFCRPCLEGLWLQLLKRVDLIDELVVTYEGSGENLSIHLTPVQLGEFRGASPSSLESLEISWALNGTLLPQYSGKTIIDVPRADALGSWQAFVNFKTEEIRVESKYLTGLRSFSI